MTKTDGGIATETPPLGAVDRGESSAAEVSTAAWHRAATPTDPSKKWRYAGWNSSGIPEPIGIRVAERRRRSP